MTLIKNCGLKDTRTIDAAIKTGASFIGLVHHQASPRHLDYQHMKELARHIGDKADHVAVMVNPHDTAIDDMLAHYKPNYLQVHNVMSPSRISDIKSRTKLKVIAAIAIHDAEDLKPAKELAYVSDFVLFDTKQQNSHGGTGKTFNWDLLKGFNVSKPWFLAGGLTFENVAQAISLTGAPMVDVSSGIEYAPGEKSLEKIAAFNTAVLDH